MFFGERILDLKKKVLSAIQSLPVLRNIKSCLKYKVPEAFEIRMADEDEDVLPNMDFPPFDNNLNVIDSNNQQVCFIEREDYNPEEMVCNIVGNQTVHEKKIVLKIHIKIGNRKTNYCILEESSDKNLKNVLERLEKKNIIIGAKKSERFYFCDHELLEDEEKDFNPNGNNTKFYAY